jgi:hypothetical protein
MRPSHARLTPVALALALLAAAPAALPQTPAGAQRTLTVAPAPAAATSVRRVALVIGNNRYASAPLLNPVNDAQAMAKTLSAAGFQVILRTDASQREMLAALRDFGNLLKDGGAGLFYFAGHGMQIKGRNFLIPVGADIEREDEVAYQALDAQAVLDKMESAGNGTNLVILDACRNNPFARSFRSSSQGLAQMDAPVGTMVAFSTAPGSVASDGNGSNGLYTQHLLGALQQPGLKVEEVFKQVRAAVRRESRGAQVPWESTSLEGDFYFVPPVPVVAAPPPDPLAALDDALWEAVKDSTQPAELGAYLRRFPAGRHAALATQRLAAVTKLPDPVTATLGAAPAPLVATGSAALAVSVAAPLSVAPAAALAPTLAALPPAAAAPTPSAQTAADIITAPLPEVDPQESSRNERAIAESNRRIAEIVRWGDEDTDRRPAEPRRNANGFAEGDRWRWAVLDRQRGEYTGEVFWRIDGIEADGRLRVNDGAVELDPLGHSAFDNRGRQGSWVRWEPPMDVASVVALPPGSKRDVAGLRTGRGPQGGTLRIDFSGSARHAGTERVTVRAGSFDAVRVDVSANGSYERNNGARGLVTWRLSYWFVPGMGLPVAWDLDERIDGRLERRMRHELLAFDVLASPLRMADTTR